MSGSHIAATGRLTVQRVKTRGVKVPLTFSLGTAVGSSTKYLCFSSTLKRPKESPAAAICSATPVLARGPLPNSFGRQSTLYRIFR